VSKGIDFAGYVVRKTKSPQSNVIITSLRTQIEDGALRGNLTDALPPRFSVNYTGSTHRTFGLVSVKSTCVLAIPLPKRISPVRIEDCTVRFVGRERKGNILVDRQGLEFDISSTAPFATTTFGSALKGVEDIKLELVKALLPTGLSLLDVVFASVTFDDVKVEFYD
jgi:hypothetical protein